MPLLLLLAVSKKKNTHELFALAFCAESLFTSFFFSLRVAVLLE